MKEFCTYTHRTQKGRGHRRKGLSSSPASNSKAKQTDGEGQKSSTEVLTASGEVHTDEEAQVFVHDLNLFATVQLLEETLAVLSPGKLCKDHGYTTSGSAVKSHD